MSPSVFSFLSYRGFLKSIFYESELKLSIIEIEKKLGYKSSSLNKILNSSNSLPIDKAFLLTKELQLNNLERDYFLLLIQHNDSGTEALKSYFSKRINKFFKQSFFIQNKNEKEIHTSNYTDWVRISILHLLKVEPDLCALTISKRLSVSLTKIELEMSKIDENILENYITNDRNLNLGLSYINNQDLSYKKSWRRKGFTNIEKFDGKSIRSVYTLQSTISPQKERHLLSTYLRTMKLIEIVLKNDVSDDKKLYQLNLDLFMCLDLNN